jgi:hypothetical protein
MPTAISQQTQQGKTGGRRRRHAGCRPDRLDKGACPEHDSNV